MTSDPKRGPGRRLGPTAKRSSGAATPAIVFAILVAVVAVVAGAAFLLDSGSAQGPATAASSAAPAESPTDLSLTDEEAIKRFKELDRLRREAIESRNQSALEKAFVVGSPAGRRAAATIKQLIRDKVQMKAVHYDELSLSVNQNNPDRVTIRQQVVIETGFFDPSGRDVTTSGRRERQTIHWVLRPERGGWYLFEATITHATPANA